MGSQENGTVPCMLPVCLVRALGRRRESSYACWRKLSTSTVGRGPHLYFRSRRTKRFGIANGRSVADNPSFSNMKEVCVKLKELDKPFIIVARSNLLLTKWFRRIFKLHLQVIIPDRSPTFTHLTKPKKGYVPPYGVFFYCYKMKLHSDIIFLE